MNREERLLIEAQELREAQARREIGVGLFEVIQEVQNGQGSWTAGMPDDTLGVMGLAAPAEDVAENRSDAGSEKHPAPQQTQRSSDSEKEEPLPQAVARLELERGIDPASRADLSLDERITDLENLG